MTHRLSLFFIVLMVFSCLIFFYQDFFFAIFFAYFFYLAFIPLRGTFLRGSLLKKIILIAFVVFLPVFFIYNFFQFLLLIQNKIPILSQRIPLLQEKLGDYYQTLEINWPILDSLNMDVKVGEFFTDFIEKVGKIFLQSIPSLLMRLLNFLILIPLFLLFFFKDASLLRREFYKFIPNYFFEKVTYFIHFFHKNFGIYMFSRFLEAFLVFLLLYIGSLLLGLDQVFFLSFFPGLLVFIPYLGPILGFFPGPLLYIFDLLSIEHLKSYIILYLLVQAIDLFLIFPLLVSRMIKMHPLLIFFSLFLGAQILGILGMMISIPIAAFVKLLYEHLHRDLYEK